MTTTARLATLLFVSAFAAFGIGCDSGGEDDAPLALGEFSAATTGGIEDRLRGEASFSVRPYALDEEEIALRLSSGAFRAPGGDDKIDLGIFLSAPWTGVPGTLTLPGDARAPLTRFGNAVVLPSSETFGFPAWFEVTSGTLTIKELTDDRVAGRFDVTAESVVISLIEFDDIRAQGTFIAKRAQK